MQPRGRLPGKSTWDYSIGFARRRRPPEDKLKVSFRLPTQTAWADGVSDFNGSDPSPLQTDGEGAHDEPLRTGSDANGSFVDLPVTFGGFSTSSSGNRIYLRIAFEDTNAPRPTQKITRVEVRDKNGAGATGAVWQ